MDSEETVKVNGDGKEDRRVVLEKRGKVQFRVGEKKHQQVGLDNCGGGFERFTEK